MKKSVGSKAANSSRRPTQPSTHPAARQQHAFAVRSPDHSIHKVFSDRRIPAVAKPVSKVPGLNPCQIHLVDHNPIVDDEL